MIYSLEGILQGCQQDSMVVNVHGIFLEVMVSVRHSEALHAMVGQKIHLWVVMRVSDDGIHLYGFASEEERSLFLLLKLVTGVGAKVALSLLGAFGTSGLVDHIQKDNEAALCSVSGVGKRLASRLCNELKERLDDFATVGSDEPLSHHRDAVAALTQWGYGWDEAQKAVAEVAMEDNDSVSQLIAAALKRMGA